VPSILQFSVGLSVSWTAVAAAAAAARFLVGDRSLKALDTGAGAGT